VRVRLRRARQGAPRGCASAGRRTARRRRPAGQAVPAAQHAGHATLVGGGYGSAPLLPLAAALRERGCRVDVVLGRRQRDRLFGQLEAKRMADSIAVTTDDGSLGRAGRVSDVLPGVLERTDATSSTPAGRWRCCARSPTSPPRGHPLPGRRRGVDGLRASASA
jgi:NAD(P)H-flavin reductase